MKRNITTVLLALCCLALLANSVFASNKKTGDKKSHKVVSYEDLSKLVKDKKVTLLDCNGTESYKKGHIPTALDGKADNLKDSLPKDKSALIVAYCGSEKCTAWKGGAKMAKKLGYSNIKHFKGGLKGWTAKGGTLDSVKADK